MTCADWMHRCWLESRGLLILENSCVISPQRNDLRSELFTPDHNMPHPVNAYHQCEYYTCRHFVQECVDGSEDKYNFSRFNRAKILLKKKTIACVAELE